MSRQDAMLSMRQLLIKRRDALRKALAGDHSRLEELRAKTSGDMVNTALDSVKEEISSQLAEVESRELTRIEYALERMSAGQFGICEVCGAKITISRLKASPYATQCPPCQRRAKCEENRPAPEARSPNAIVADVLQVETLATPDKQSLCNPAGSRNFHEATMLQDLTTCHDTIQVSSPNARSGNADAQSRTTRHQQQKQRRNRQCRDLHILGSLKRFHLLHLSKPASDRLVYRGIVHFRPRTIVEIGMGTCHRSLRMIWLASQFRPARDIQFTGIDRFEACPLESDLGVTLRTAHRMLRATGHRIRLVPGLPLKASRSLPTYWARSISWYWQRGLIQNNLPRPGSIFRVCYTRTRKSSWRPSNVRDAPKLGW